jgi:hypothetical protein
MPEVYPFYESVYSGVPLEFPPDSLRRLYGKFQEEQAGRGTWDAEKGWLFQKQGNQIPSSVF